MAKTQPANPENLLPLTPAVFHILLALVDEERHGYAIMQDVAEQTNGKLQLGPGTLYGCLKRMATAGLVVEWEGRPNAPPNVSPNAGTGDDRRRYYQMTALGLRVIRAEAERLVQAVSTARARRLLQHSGAKV